MFIVITRYHATAETPEDEPEVKAFQRFEQVNDYLNGIVEFLRDDEKITVVVKSVNV